MGLENYIPTNLLIWIEPIITILLGLVLGLFFKKFLVSRLISLSEKNNWQSDDVVINAINSVKVIVTPWEKGFTCGIIMDSKSKMTTEQYELCSTIARGMIKMATTDPHSTFLWGLRGFADDKNKNDKTMTISSVAEFDDDSNVVDFLEFLKNKRDKELN